MNQTGSVVGRSSNSSQLSNVVCLLPEDVVLPDKPKLKFLNKVPNFKKAKKEKKKLRDIQGPAKAANTFTVGNYAIVVGSR